MAKAKKDPAPARKAKGSDGGKNRRAKAEVGPPREIPPPRLKLHYRGQVAAALQQEFGYASSMAVPRIAMIKINMGHGGKPLRTFVSLMRQSPNWVRLPGKRPIITKARKSIAAFKVREGMPIGVAVTLRGDRMYEFLDRLISIGLPRVRDFRGISTKAFDGRGNYTLGLKEHVVFPEIDYAKIDGMKGNEHYDRDDGQDRSGIALAVASHGVCLSATKGENEENTMATTGKNRQGFEEAQVRRTPPQSLLALRTPSRFHPQVRTLSYLLPRVGAARRSARRGEEQLVK